MRTKVAIDAVRRKPRGKAQAAIEALDSPHAPPDVRERLLDTAENLFALHGYNGVSVRAITEAAEVNVAAAHYHFGSKEALLQAVFDRRLKPLNEERHRLLDEAVTAAGNGRPDPTAILTAFLAPTFRLAESPKTAMFSLLSGRCSTDPTEEVRRVRFQSYDIVAERFIDLLHQSFPELTRKELFWRLSCIYGAMVYVRANNAKMIQHVLGDDLDMANCEEAEREVIPFLVAGFLRPRAPS